MPHLSALRIVLAVGAGSFWTVLGAAASSCSEGECELEKADDDGLGTVSLLQTSLHIDHGSSMKVPRAEAAAEGLHLHKVKGNITAAEISLFHGIMHNISCDAFLSVDAHHSQAVLRSLGQLPERTVCPHRHLQVALPIHHSGLKRVEVPLSSSFPRIPYGLIVVGAYVVIVTATILCMLRSLFTRPSEPKPLYKGSDQFRPEQEAWKEGLFSWFSISWVTTWVRRWGAPGKDTVTKIKSSDLGGLGDKDDECANNVEVLASIWDDHLKTPFRPGLNFDATWHMVSLICRFIGVTKVIAVMTSTGVYMFLCYLVPSYAIHWTLNFLTYMSTMQAVGLGITYDALAHPLMMIILMFTVLTVMEAFFNTFNFLLNYRINMRLQGALTSMVYRKAQRLPLGILKYDLRDATEMALTDEWGALRTTNDGYSLVQLISVDVNASLVGIIYTISRVITIFPVMLALLFALLSRLGGATFSAIIAVAVVVWFMGQAFAYQWYALRACQQMGGQRVGFLQEVMFAIRVVKPYSWEDKAETIITAYRKGELNFLTTYFRWTGVIYGSGNTLPRLVVMTVLTAYSSLHGGIKASDIFLLVQLLGAFQAASMAFSGLLPAMFLAGPSLGRLQIFLSMKEAEMPTNKLTESPSWVTLWPPLPTISPRQIPSSMIERPEEPTSVMSADTKPMLRMQGSFSWLSNQPPVLHNLDLTVEHGQVVAVLGHVGSGKSTLLQALLGELYPCGDARLSIPEKTAYHSQVAYICEGTLKDNIVFCQGYDENRYNQAVFAACLRQDLAMLPGGDGVPIGSRGITLSGGQKARVSIARAVYSMGTELTLFDDPLASVDRGTGMHILKESFFGSLMKDRTCIIALQPDEQTIHMFDKVIVMEDGRIVAQGTPKDIVKSDAFQKLLASSEQAAQTEEVRGKLDVGGHQVGPGSLNRDTPSEGSTEAIVLREEESEGRLDMACLKFYIEQGGYGNAVSCVVFFLLMCVANLLIDMTMAQWTNAALHGEIGQGIYKQLSEGVHADAVRLNVTKYILQSIAWLFVAGAMYGASFVTGSNLSLSISGVIHGLVLKKLLKAPIDRFYDKTPVGRILNRMSNDVMNIDFRMYMQVTSTLGQLISWVIPMLYVHMVMPLVFSIFMIPWYVLQITILRRFTNVVVPLRYLTNVTRSEVNTHFTEVENAKATVRAYQVHNQFSAASMASMDNLLKAQFASDCTTRWTENRILMLYSFFATSIVLVGILFNTSMGTIGLCLINAVRIIMSVDMVVDNLCAAQFEFISMNRLHEYLQIPQEREDVLLGDNKLMSISHVVRRKCFGKLEATHSAETGLISIVRPAGNEESSGQIIFEQVPGTAVFSFCGLKAATWISNLDKPELDLEKHGKEILRGQMQAEHTRVEDLDISHYLVAVGSRTGNAAAVAEELCHGATDELMLRFSSSWMIGGAMVKFTDVIAGYGDIPVDILKGINLEIPARSKVAFCGRTGCGKSTTILTLLRILELRSGMIEINHVNIQDIGLRALRRAVGLVPQDPVVFSGNIRNNLDPFSEFPDAFLWSALAKVQLHPFVSAHGLGLYMPISVDGANMSFGQRQLLCMARMILRQPGLLLLDECTSSIDPQTQELVQRSIRESFPFSTLIVVAHRLETILDFEMVVVMDKGRVVEKGSPKALANMKDGCFKHMLHQGMGPESSPVSGTRKITTMDDVKF